MKNFRFSPAFFLPQTILEVTTHRGEIKRFEITGLCRTGPDLYVFDTAVPHPAIADVTEAYAIDYVTRIIRYGNGTRKPGKPNALPAYRGKKETLQEYTQLMGRPSKRAGSRYAVYSPSGIVHHVIADYQGDHVVDGDKLMRLLESRGILRYEGLMHMLVPVNKKKLRKAIRQLMPRCYLRAAATQKLRDEEDDRRYAEDMDKEWERDHQETVNTEEAESCYSPDEEYPFADDSMELAVAYADDNAELLAPDDAFNVEVADDELTRKAYLEEMGAKEMMRNG